MRWLICSLLMSVAGANAGTVLFSDLGSGASVYTADQSEIGTQGIGHGSAIEHASLFTVSGTGIFNVTQIDLGVAQAGASTGNFIAGLWTDVGGVPGVQLGSWEMSTSNPPFTCCALATQTGITGVSLTGGTSYFMVMSSQISTDKVYWQPNPFGTTHTALGSVNGGASWLSDPGAKIEAYDVLGNAAVSTPEPASWCLVGSAGLLLGFFRRKRA